MGASLLKKVFVAFCLLSSVPASAAWIRQFGSCYPNANPATCCEFSGTDGVPTMVSRTGNCSSGAGYLDLSFKNINGFATGVFAGMGKLE